MAVTTDQVKELRERTGVSVMQCKNALEESDGDVEEALIALRKSAGAQVDKKADRELGAGVVEAYIHNNKEVGAIVVLSCETDFVAKNEDFVRLARDIAMQITATNPRFIGEHDMSEEDKKSVMEGEVLLEQPYIKDGDKTIKDMLSEAVQKFGERVELSDFTRFSIK